jgi:fatty acid desaturase
VEDTIKTRLTANQQGASRMKFSWIRTLEIAVGLFLAWVGLQIFFVAISFMEREGIIPQLQYLAFVLATIGGTVLVGILFMFLGGLAIATWRWCLATRRGK